ncbi:hypothetical protein ACFSM0_14600 [Rhodobacter lacus]|uniref:Uncharacterized protein n=1 Tax=Rhodobacter lacus TaxID=1641972 RepID=A0ABW5AAH6_9RHOB
MHSTGPIGQGRKITAPKSCAPFARKVIPRDGTRDLSGAVRATAAAHKTRSAGARLQPDLAHRTLRDPTSTI